MYWAGVLSVSYIARMGFKNCVATQSPPITRKTIICWLASLLSKIATIRILYLLVVVRDLQIIYCDHYNQQSERNRH